MITLEQLKQYLGVCNQDVLLQILVDSANQIIKSYTGRKFEYSTYTEYVDGNAQQELLLENYPVGTLTKIERNVGTLDVPVWEVISASTYKLSPNIGKIFFVCPLIRGFQNYKISYTAGFATPPGDLVLAGLKIASRYFNSRTSDEIS